MEQMRLHHVGIVLPTLKQAHDFIDRFGLEIDYEGFVDAYHADLIFTKKSTFGSPLEFIIPKEGVLCDFNNGKGGIEEKGMGMLEDKAVPGTDDIIVNFLRPRFNDGILVEFVETVAPIKRD